VKVGQSGGDQGSPAALPVGGKKVFTLAEEGQ
jgi:hypothetical protein